ncbi:hypothetical protein FOL47_000244 [Perkinsus chesapeaki]|uniref:Methyltransferase FkbM domain-containing protein n=1 Tax=Perkinsus chesapeaki TaxID=330153 RepID=A0A7J6MM68_PERCH|nr:hypothetical protein FOL47_000244 [Perkinsus chesapeaki]
MVAPSLSAACFAVADLSATPGELHCHRGEATIEPSHFLYNSWPKVWGFIQHPKHSDFYADPHGVLDEAVGIINAYVGSRPEPFLSRTVADELGLVNGEGACISAVLLSYYTWQYWAPVNVEEAHTVRAGLHLMNLILTDCAEEPSWSDIFTVRHNVSPWIMHYALYSRVLLEYMEGDLAKPPQQQLSIGQADINSIVKLDGMLTTASTLQQRKFDAPTGGTVIDLGMDRGQDTLYFLSLNFTTHSVDANPTAIRSLHFNKWFKLKVAQGKMIPYNFAVVRNVTSAAVEVCEQDWEMTHVLADGDSQQCRKVQKVKAVTCAQIIRRVTRTSGPIRFMKIDIQGHDLACLASFYLIPVEQRPALLQLEGPFSTAESVAGAIESLVDLGYGQMMKVTNQMLYCPRFVPFGCASGPSPVVQQDVFTGKSSWRPASELIADAEAYVASSSSGVWLDFVCKKSSL